MRMRAMVPLLALVLNAPGAAAMPADAVRLDAEPAQDSLRLGTLLRAATERDPRARQAALQAQATELRLQSISAERMPQISLRAEAAHQSEVPAIPITLPNVEVPIPPKDRVEVALELNLSVYDGGVRQGRRGVEEAQLRAAQAELSAQLYPLRMEVTEAFFAAFLLQERLREAGTLLDDLEARLTLVRAQARGGAALPGDTAALRAELLGAAQQRDELAAERLAALAVLARLTGRESGEGDVLVLPDLPDPAGADVPRTHPQYALFAARRARLERETALVRARTQPQVSAFGQLAYGRPGYAQFREDLHEYWMGGVRVRWVPWDWGAAGRERGVIAIQRQIVDTEEAAFTDRLQREVQDDLQAAARLRAALQTDERIVLLREQVERQARAQLEERAITPAAYVDARTDLQEARIARQRHRVELARARARWLTTLGIEVGS